MSGRPGPRPWWPALVAAWRCAAAEVYEMRDVRTCKGHEKAYAACEGLPACGAPCAPRDCLFSDWGRWRHDEGCSGLCFRKRGIQADSNECGQPCAGPQIESKACQKPECLVVDRDCTLSLWSDWSACSSAAEQRFRFRTLMDLPQGDGAPCRSHLNETSPCGERHLLDCVLGEWGQWTACSASCDGGYRAALRKVLRHAQEGGRPCEGTLRKTESCNALPCTGAAARDCLLSPWGEWQGCNFASPKQRVRSREVASAAEGGGRACGEALKETAGCAPEPREDCAFTDWSAWDRCDKTCGGGQTYRRRALASEPRNGGTCAQLASLSETASCGTEPCLKAHSCALMPWADWSACSASCDTGVRERAREMLYKSSPRRLQLTSLLDHFADGVVHAQNTTEDCTGGFNGALKEVAPCVTRSCPRKDCKWGDWSAWSQCSSSCGGGTQERSREVRTPPDVGGAPCDARDTGEVAVCNTQPCEFCLDGAWGDWSEWNSCSASCGRGFRSRHRDVSQHPNKCGKPATGLEDDVEACDAALGCVPDMDCKVGAWSAWSPCSESCFGVTERSREVLTLPSGNGRSCDAEALKQLEMCNPRSGEAAPANCLSSAKDPAPCRFAAWSDWGACSASCGRGQAGRSRHVLSPASELGKLCNGTLSELRPCSSQACPHEKCLDCAYGDWAEWGACAKCGGQRYRQRSIMQLPNECGKPCAVGDLKQAGPCKSECEEERWCAWSAWTGYGECSSDCGPATRTRQRRLAVHKEKPLEPLFNGTGSMMCEGMQLDSSPCEYRSCSPSCTPVDCGMSDWTEWSQPACTQLCERTRAITAQGACGGEACTGSLVETKHCPAACHAKQDCALSDWEAWSRCEAPDSQTFRKRRITQEALNGGEPCQGSLTETQLCSAPGLPRHCELSTWAEWSECTKSCMGGLKQRRREVSAKAANGGEPCSGGLEELAACNEGHCTSEVRDCEMAAWGAWSPCAHNGQRWRERTVTPAQGGGRVCEGALHELQQCSQAVDCALSDWSQWDSCDKTCDGGQQQRHRLVVRNPRMGGAACAAGLMETRGCGEEPCGRVDCEVAGWSAWSACAATCGPGQRHRERRILQEPKNGGVGCGLQLTQLDACVQQPCKFVDCEWGMWADWSECSAPCGSGQRVRKREVVQAPDQGGKPCLPLSKEEVGICNDQPCADQTCVDGAWGDWEEWSKCSSSCDGGITWRSRPVRREANHCGRPAVGPMRVQASCNEFVPCTPSVDCLFADWGEWSACSSSCSGVQRRSRKVAQHGSGNGRYCVGPLEETSPCHPGPGRLPPLGCGAPVPMDCLLSDWAQWGSCTASCGGGSRTRERQLVQAPQNGGQPCPQVLSEVVGCNRESCSAHCAPQDCAWDDWSQWSACDKCGGERKRFRHIAREASCGGTACRPGASEETSNCTRACHEPVYCMWGDWQAWGSCSATCGSGQKVRERHLQATTGQQLRFLKDYDVSQGVDEALLRESIGSLEERTRALRVRRLQLLTLAFGSGGVALVMGFVLLRAFSRGRGEGTRPTAAIFSRVPLSSSLE